MILEAPRDTPWQRRHALCALLLGLAATSCAQTSATPPASLRAEIEQMIGSAPCSKNSECHVIGLGARDCGGPQEYKAWSSAHTDGTRLQVLVAKDAQVQRLENERLGRRSTCQVLPEPAVECTRPADAPTGPGRCTLLPRGPGSPAIR